MSVRSDETEQAADGLCHLTVTTFDDSVDRSSIGTGRFDLTTGKNVPCTIAGDPVADYLSFLYDSSFALDPCRL